MLRNFSDKLTDTDAQGAYELNCLVMIIEDSARKQWASRVKVTKKYETSKNRITLLEQFDKELAREYDAQHAALTALKDYPVFREKLLEGFHQ